MGGDENCDGFDDYCLDGDHREGYSGEAGTRDVGICQGYLEECWDRGEGFQYYRTREEIRPEDEVLNDEIDQNCDGYDDQCIGGEERGSYSGLGVTRGIGICQDKIETCEDRGEGMLFYETRPERLPVDEVLEDGIDQNCDGHDELCVMGQVRDLLIRKIASNVGLSWTMPPEGEPSSYYQIYSGTSPDSLRRLTTVVAGSHSYWISGLAFIGTGSSFYYQVTSVCMDEESEPSNMGYVFRQSLTYYPDDSNRHWISLPYRTGYATLADLLEEINGISDITKEAGRLRAPALCDLVARYNAATQAYENVFWGGTAWLSEVDNYDTHEMEVPLVVAGEGIEINILTDFNLMLFGANDPDFTFDLTYHADGGNRNFISIPYDSSYVNLMDIVNDINDGPVPGTCEKITRWNPTSQLYESRTWFFDLYEWLRIPEEDVSVVPGEAFEIIINADTVFRPVVR